MIIAHLSTLKARGAYLPLDPNRCACSSAPPLERRKRQPNMPDRYVKIELNLAINPKTISSILELMVRCGVVVSLRRSQCNAARV
jgi:hypothetical protein